MSYMATDVWPYCINSPIANQTNDGAFAEISVNVYGKRPESHWCAQLA